MVATKCLVAGSLSLRESDSLFTREKRHCDQRQAGRRFELGGRQNGSEDYFLALKMTTLTKPKHMRYYGFARVQMTVGDKCYLCQHSTKAEANSEHTVDTYMTKFLAGDMKNKQTYHVSLCHTSLAGPDLTANMVQKSVKVTL